MIKPGDVVVVKAYFSQGLGRWMHSDRSPMNSSQCAFLVLNSRTVRVREKACEMMLTTDKGDLWFFSNLVHYIIGS